ncbi:MAG: vitamin K epoxide reductase family protein [Candidatus Magasanikbacteria bacterium]|nr:vitamin K epoxide reductase family protein [Candidatus Magasanikbacteria bacterium]
MDEFKALEKIIPAWLNAVFLLVALIGFADATYLTVAYYSGLELICGLASACNAVTTSAYSRIGSIPVALLGSLFYLSMIILSLAYIDTKSIVIARIRSWTTCIGFGASFVFVYLQLFVIGIICTYCMVSAGTSTLLFILGVYSFFQMKRKDKPVRN